MHFFIELARGLGDLAEALNRNPFGVAILAVLACIGIVAVKALGVPSSDAWLRASAAGSNRCPGLPKLRI